MVAGRVDATGLKGPHRLFYQRMKLAKIVELVRPTLIAMEDYAMAAGGRNNNNVFSIGELGGVLKTYFWENGLNVLPVAPTQMKSVIAGNGRAEKVDVIRELAQRFDIHVKQHDEADAVGLMLVGEMRCGFTTDAFPRMQGKAQLRRFESVRDTPLVLGKGSTL